MKLGRNSAFECARNLGLQRSVVSCAIQHFHELTSALPFIYPIIIIKLRVLKNHLLIFFFKKSSLSILHGTSHKTTRASSTCQAIRHGPPNTTDLTSCDVNLHTIMNLQKTLF